MTQNFKYLALRHNFEFTHPVQLMRKNLRGFLAPSHRPNISMFSEQYIFCSCPAAEISFREVHFWGFLPFSRSSMSLWHSLPVETSIGRLAFHPCRFLFR